MKNRIANFTTKKVTTPNVNNKLDIPRAAHSSVSSLMTAYINIKANILTHSYATPPPPLNCELNSLNCFFSCVQFIRTNHLKFFPIDLLQCSLLDFLSEKHAKIPQLFFCGVNACSSNHHLTYQFFLKNNVWTSIVLMLRLAGLKETLSVYKPISRSIHAPIAEINYSNASGDPGAKLTHINSYLTDGSLYCQLRIAGICPFTHNDVASVSLSNTLRSRVMFLTVNPVGIFVCAYAHLQFKVFKLIYDHYKENLRK